LEEYIPQVFNLSLLFGGDSSNKFIRRRPFWSARGQRATSGAMSLFKDRFEWFVKQVSTARNLAWLAGVVIGLGIGAWQYLRYADGPWALVAGVAAVGVILFAINQSLVMYDRYRLGQATAPFMPHNTSEDFPSDRTPPPGPQIINPLETYF
jgi:hypothetical protein